MRFRNLLGLLAIGGAVAYAQKKRGGDLSFAGIKNSLKNVFDNVKGQLGSVMGQQQDTSATNTGTSTRRNSAGTSNVGTSNLGSVGGRDDVSGTTGYAGSSGYGSEMNTGIGSTSGNGIGGSGIGRKY